MVLEEVVMEARTALEKERKKKRSKEGDRRPTVMCSVGRWKEHVVFFVPWTRDRV